MNGTNYILFIAGGIWQKPFVQYLKNKGHKLAIVNPVETETTNFADYHIKCDINNFEEIKKHINIINPICITSDQSDVSTLIVAELSELFKLPGNSVETIRKFTDKLAMYEFSKIIGMPVPQTRLVNSVKNVLDFAKEYTFPIIIKPVDSTMSRGFVKINSKKEITNEVFNNTLKFSKSKKVIAQKFIEGNMVTMEGVCSGNKHKTIASSIKTGYFEAGITSAVYYPTNLSDDLLKKIEKANDEYVELAGLNFGLTHSEYLVCNNDFCLVETGARGGGAGISNIITPWTSGIDNYDIFYRSLMGEIVDVKSLNPLKRNALLRYYRKEDISEKNAFKIKELPKTAIFCYNFIGTQYIANNQDCRYSMGIYLTENNTEMLELQKRIENFK